MRRFAIRSLIFMDAYRKGLNEHQAAFTHSKYLVVYYSQISILHASNCYAPVDTLSKKYSHEATNLDTRELEQQH
jgi:hypothetical protein